jgi:DNA ligase (NAD+)
MKLWLACLALFVGRALMAADWGPPPPEAEARHEDLRAEIRRLDDAYFRRAEPEVSDATYDGLKRELALLERTYPALAAAPARLGDDRSGLFRTARHRVPMLGLDKVHTEAELRAFVAGAQAGPDGFVIEPKVDGVALALTYEQGRLVRAVTRGDGREGDDVTDLVRGLPGLPGELAGAGLVPALVELRGELHVPVAVFAGVNRRRAAAGEPGFANPRSSAAGALRQTDPQELARRGLAVVIHGFGAWEPAETAPGSQGQFQDRVRGWGLPALAGVRQATDADAVCRAVEAMGRARFRADLPLDGVVVKVAAVARQRALGESVTGPRWAVAFKFAAPRAETRLRGIEVQVGRTGLLTPVAVLDPVELAGAVVTRATLHNAEEVRRLDTRIGDTVVVEKAGEVIPIVSEVVVARRAAGLLPYVFPTRCPVCGAPVEQGDGAAARRCPNEDCPAQLAGRIGHAAEREVFDLPGLGPALIESLIVRGKVRTVADIFRLQAADLVLPGRLPGAAAQNLARAIAAARGAELRRWILALSIPGVGEAAATRLAARFRDLGALANADAAALRGAGMGEATARAVTAYFAAPRHRALLGEIRSIAGQ